VERGTIRDRVLFHCPACEDDRLGEPCRDRAPWWRWLRDGAATVHLSCVGCRRVFHVHALDRAPVGTSERARLNRAVRAMAAAIVAAGDGDPRTATAALELVRSCTVLTYTPAALRADVAGSRLGTRLRGELTLLATHLSAGGAEQLLARLRVTLDTGARVTTEQQEVVEACAEHLGLDPRLLTSTAVDPAGGHRPRGHAGRRRAARHRAARRHTPGRHAGRRRRSR